MVLGVIALPEIPAPDVLVPKAVRALGFEVAGIPELNESSELDFAFGPYKSRLMIVASCEVPGSSNPPSVKPVNV